MGLCPDRSVVDRFVYTEKVGGLKPTGDIIFIECNFISRYGHFLSLHMIFVADPLYLLGCDKVSGEILVNSCRNIMYSYVDEGSHESYFGQS